MPVFIGNYFNLKNVAFGFGFYACKFKICSAGVLPHLHWKAVSF